MQDSQIVDLIKGGGKGREKACDYLLKQKEYYLFAKKFVSSLGGSSEDLEDIFSESISIIDRSIREEKFLQKSSIYTFFCAIVKNRAHKNLTKFEKETTFEHNSSVFGREFDYINDFNQKNSENSVIVSEILGLIEDRCKQLIRLHALDFSFEDIKEEMGFPSVEATRVAMSRCRKNTKEKIKQNEKLKLLINNLKLNLTRND